MARTFIRQETQIRNSDLYDDTLAAGATMESTPVSIEDDLNTLRSQVKRFSGEANWFDPLSGNTLASVSTIANAVSNKRVLCRTEILTDIAVPAAQNYKILSVAGSEAPTVNAAVAGTVNGAVVAQSTFSGAGFAIHELITSAGPNAISPKNLLVVVDATSGQLVQSSGRDVYGLLQYESTGVDNVAFNDTSAGNRAKISFVRLNAARDNLEACPSADIAGKTVNYSYVARNIFSSVPEECFLSDGDFIDLSGSVDVTLDNAVDNQSGPVTQVQTVNWRISDTFTLNWQDSTGGSNLLSLQPTAGGDTLQANVDTFDINNVNDADFLNGIIADSGGTPIRVGSTAGYIDTASADLGVRAGGELYLDDSNQTGSTWAQTAGIKLSDTTAEWDVFEAAFGEVSLLAAITAANSGAGTTTKTYANVTLATNADTDVGGVTGGANLDAQLPNLSLGAFLTAYDVFLNGKLLRPGANSAANNDYYPGTSLANGQLMFEFKVKVNDVICVIARA